MSLPSAIEGVDPRILSPIELNNNIIYNEFEDKWTFVDDQTNEKYEFSEALEKWIPLEVNIDNMSDAQKELLEKKRQKLIELKAEKLKKQILQKKEQRQNTSIYVSNLPLDIDLAEIKQVFTKYGVIAEDLLTSKPKIKLYQDESNNFKGDALITYLKPESVNLAIQMLDDTQLRHTGSLIKVQKAEFKEKSSKDPESSNTSSSSKRTLTEEDKRTIKKKLKVMNDKIGDWNGEDDKINPKWAKTVILKRVFTLKELKEDSYAQQDIIEDIQEGCGEIGYVDKVILFDQEEEGIVLVRFKDEDSATQCREKMDGRYFSGQKLIALRYNGEQFQKTEDRSNTKNGDDETQRLESYIKQNS